LQITVDALRGDLPTRYSHVLGEGGFRYLMEEGVHYTNAHYQHANTETIVGHASLATGTVPALHGMVGNVWYDRGDGRLVYNIEDSRYRLLTAGADVDQDTEIDPTQKAASVDGRSPAAMLASTFSDELAVHYNGRSKIFAVSVKDRGAVSLAGHAGKAFWFSKATGEFVTSSYYYDAYPDWVSDWNARKQALAYAGKRWELMHEPSQYLFGDSDDREYETDFPGYGRTFPHPYGAAGDKYLTTRLTLGPAGDELTLDFAKALLDEEGLGQDEIPDYLAVSFSSTDYVGHIFGASSLESEDNLAHLDRTLAELVRYVEKKVGLQNTLVVLSADHGQPEIPQHMNELGMAAASYFDLSSLEASPGLAALKADLGIDAPLIEDFQYPYVYLDRELIRAAGLELAEVEAAVAEVIASMENIEAAISISALRSGSLADTTINRAVLNNYHPDRSGDIALVLAPYVFINDFDGLTVASTHGSVWRYDRFVPVVFAGAGVRPATVARPVTPYDIAPTLAAFLGVKAPSSAIGEPLPEVLRR
jgi:predicted AlkP superfamily pyrophosphatase or phosphodiesterase